MKTLLLSVLSLFLFVGITTSVSAQEIDEDSIKVVYVDEGISLEEEQKIVQDIFDSSDVEYVNVKYKPSLIQLRDGNTTNTETFYYLSIAYYTKITCTGYVSGSSVSNFVCSVVTSGYPVVHNSTTYYNRTSTSCYAMVKVTLDGAVPHTYSYRAPLIGDDLKNDEITKKREK